MASMKMASNDVKFDDDSGRAFDYWYSTANSSTGNFPMWNAWNQSNTYIPGTSTYIPGTSTICLPGTLPDHAQVINPILPSEWSEWIQSDVFDPELRKFGKDPIKKVFPRKPLRMIRLREDAKKS